jgi:hypothetical protein
LKIIHFSSDIIILYANRSGEVFLNGFAGSVHLLMPDEAMHTKLFIFIMCFSCLNGRKRAGGSKGGIQQEAQHYIPLSAHSVGSKKYISLLGLPPGRAVH